LIVCLVLVDLRGVIAGGYPGGLWKYSRGRDIPGEGRFGAGSMCAEAEIFGVFESGLL